jgi:ankyrin repeat protein
MSLLVALLRDDDFEGAHTLISTDGGSIRASDGVQDDGEEPSIFYALKSVETVERILLASPESAWVSNSLGERPLHCACKLGHIDIEVIRILLFAFPEGASIRNHAGKLPIHYAAANIHDIDILKEVVEVFPQGLDMKEHRNDSKPLHYACAFKLPKPAVVFLCTATDRAKHATEETDGQGNLPLHLALMYEADIDVSFYLLDLYPNAAKLSDGRNRSSLQLAVQSPVMTEKFINALISKYPPAVNTPYAAPQGGGDASTAWFIGKKPIHVALKSGTKANVIRSLLSATLSSDYIESMKTITQEGKSLLQKKREGNSLIIGDCGSGGTKEEKNESGGEGVETVDVTDLQIQGGSMDDDDDDDDDGSGGDVVKNSAAEDMEHGVLFGDTILHTALEFNAPEEVLKTIMEVLPQIIKEPNDDGKLPIHYAAWRQSPIAVLNLLIKYYPEGLTVLDKKNDNLALHYGIQYSPRGEQADVSVALCLLSHSPAAVFTPNRGGYYPIHLAARAASSSELIVALLRICPYSYGFKTQNYLRLLPVDFALFFGAPTTVISMLLGIPKRLTTTPNPEHGLHHSSSARPPLVWEPIDGHGEEPPQLPNDAGMEHPPAEEVSIDEEHPLRSIGGLKTSLFNLQEKYMQQGEEMRKMRIRVHQQSKSLNEKTKEIEGFKRDIGWRSDRVKILEKEVKLLTAELKALK